MRHGIAPAVPAVVRLLISYLLESVMLSRPRINRLFALSSFLMIGLLATRGMAQVDVEEAEERAMRAAVQRVSPSVVRIETIGGLEQVGGNLVGTGPTTGLIVGDEGWILSSAFNFAQKPSSILVTLPGGKRAAAEIVARDHARMLVLLKVSTTEKLPVAPVMPREELLVGQWAIAVGRTFEQPEANASVGIISATNRIWGKAIQTDAKISPSNYGGPLIDLRGRVMGVLVPFSPAPHGDQAETAGAELYDSGIGFAVPLSDILPRLERMKQRADLWPGKLGVSLKGQDNNSDAAVIGHVQVKGPAAAAGIKIDDKIVELAGSPVTRLGELRLALGRYYAGEKVHLVVSRGDQRVEADLVLAEKIDPYQHAFLGFLPRRDASPMPGVVVRYIYPGSGAEKAGLKVDDRVTALDDKPVADLKSCLELVAAHEPGQKVKVTVQRGSQTETVEITAAAIPGDIPASLPEARRVAELPAERPAVGVVPIKVPEEANECMAYVPENYDPRATYGLVLWLHAPGGYEQKELVERWKTLCEKHDLILLAPKSADPNRWQPTELEFLRKAIDDVLGRYSIDRTRVVAHGYQGGAALAYVLGFTRREVIRGVAAIDSPMPLRTQTPDNEPLQRLAFYVTLPEKSKLTAAIQATIKKLEELKFPVVAKKVPESRYLDAAELEELMRWIDTLDRV